MTAEWTEEELCAAEETLGHKFSDRALLRTCFTHASLVNSGEVSNERLEFLGDAVLELISSEFLYLNYRDMPEGNLTKLRASLVCEPTLAICTKDLNLHGSAAELLCTLLSQHPAHRVRHIALTASVGADNPGDSVVEFKFYLVRKGLESLQLNSFQKHSLSPPVSFRITQDYIIILRFNIV